jgi:hypothetical protein
MTFERRFLLDQETQASDAATRRVQLPRSGVLSGISLRVRITNGATSGDEKIFTAIDRVEVVADGSNVLFSCSGAALYRLAHFVYGHEPPHRQSQTLSVVQELEFPILFGRYFGDPEIGLNLGNYRDCELRIQYSPTIAATSFVTGTTSFHAVLWIDDDVAGASARFGFLRTTEAYAFTSVAAGDEIIDLARAYRYWDIMVFARETAIDDGVDITRAQIWVNDRAKIPFDGRWDEIQAENESVQQVDGSHSGIMFRGDTETFDTHTGRIFNVVITPIFTQSDANGIITVAVASITGDQLAMSVSDTGDAAAATHFTAAAADRNIHWRAKGLGVGNAILIPFATGNNPDLALPAPDYARLQLALTNGGAGATVEVLTRELVAA